MQQRKDVSGLHAKIEQINDVLLSGRNDVEKTLNMSSQLKDLGNAVNQVNDKMNAMSIQIEKGSEKNEELGKEVARMNEKQERMEDLMLKVYEKLDNVKHTEPKISGSNSKKK